MKYSLIVILLLAQVQLFAQRGGEEGNAFEGEGLGIVPDGNWCSSLVLKENKAYVISGWVKEEHSLPQKSYTSAIKVQFYNTSEGLEVSGIGEEVSPDPASLVVLPLFRPSGNIIDGWQRIIGKLVVPEGKELIKIELVAESDVAYFDDIRIHPFNGNLKSFAYDDNNKRLMAELDENNYATRYEYNEEGELIRIKKETERGIMTIQESRSGTLKTENLD